MARAMIKQYVPSDVCLTCQGCCRFAAWDSVWSPCLLDEEIQEFIDKDLPPACITQTKKLTPVPLEGGGGYRCPFLEGSTNHCKVYTFRPFECQLYPFLLSMRNKKISLTVDPHCPYVVKTMHTPAFKEYVEYLTKTLNTARFRALLISNPQILQAYEDVLDIAEVRLSDGP
ncbi:MAG: YkgJ family cysteine cluster protein [Candidatus Omnitrophica bacterium]|nr:YkgJ family cysteine cluster protein [Candidatus Omnitrophota bacterium]